MGNGINLNSELKLKLPIITVVALGEICIITLFVILGKYEHGVSIRQSFIRTALPFLISWFAISPWLGSYKMSTVYGLKQTIWRIPLIWISCGLIAIIARVVLIDSPLVINFIVPTGNINRIYDAKDQRCVNATIFVSLIGLRCTH